MDIHPIAFQLAFISLNWKKEKINDLILYLKGNHIPFEKFFSINDPKTWKRYKLKFMFSPKEINDLSNIKENFHDFHSLALKLQKNQIEIIPITSEFYPINMKKNLNLKSLPPFITIKGNKKIFKTKMTSYQGSRNASATSLQFTEITALKEIEHNHTIVTGFARGVDRKAFETAVYNGGKTIIVLPQGVLTFKPPSQYIKFFDPENVLVLSTFFPRAGWKTPYAMERNSYISALGNKIIVPESGNTGGTWHGANYALRKKLSIFVRKPAPNEKNGNNLLIEKGAVPLDLNGNVISNSDKKENINNKNSLLNL